MKNLIAEKRAIAVYEGDSIRFVADLEPEVWSASQRLVSIERYQRLQELLASYLTLQDELRAIAATPEFRTH